MKVSLATSILACLCIPICANLHVEKRQEQLAETSGTISPSLYGKTYTSLDSSIYVSSLPSTTAAMSLTSIDEDETGGGGGGDKSTSIGGDAGGSTGVTVPEGTVKPEHPSHHTITDSTDTAIPSVYPSSIPTPSPNPNPAPYPDYTSRTCEPCSKIYRNRVYTLNNGMYCGECDIEGVRSHVNPQNGCATTREGDIDVPKDGRPIACVGTPGASPGSRACLSTCNAFVSLSRSTFPCHENTYNAGHACRMCVENGDGVVVLADDAGSIDNIRGIEFGVLLGSLATWCAAHPRCTDFQTGLRTIQDPACGMLHTGHQGGPPDQDDNTNDVEKPTSARPSASRDGYEPPPPTSSQDSQSSSSFRRSGTTSHADVSSHSPGETELPHSAASSLATRQSSPAEAFFSYLNTTSFSIITRTNRMGEAVTSTHTFTARVNVRLDDDGSMITTLARNLLPSTEVIEATSPSESITDERAFADATPSSPFTSSARRRMSMQPFNTPSGFLWLPWVIVVLGRPL